MEKVSIPYGKGKVNHEKKEMMSYQFPMGKVKLLSQNNYTTIYPYQFPMGKVKEKIMMKKICAIVLYQFPMGKVK